MTPTVTRLSFCKAFSMLPHFADEKVETPERRDLKAPVAQFKSPDIPETWKGLMGVGGGWGHSPLSPVAVVWVGMGLTKAQGSVIFGGEG